MKRLLLMIIMMFIMVILMEQNKEKKTSMSTKLVDNDDVKKMHCVKTKLASLLSIQIRRVKKKKQIHNS